MENKRKTRKNLKKELIKKHLHDQKNFEESKSWTFGEESVPAVVLGKKAKAKKRTPPAPASELPNPKKANNDERDFSPGFLRCKDFLYQYVALYFAF